MSDDEQRPTKEDVEAHLGHDEPIVEAIARDWLRLHEENRRLRERIEDMEADDYTRRKLES